jgi:hypothetical protein
VSSEAPSRAVEHDLGWTLAMVTRSYRRAGEPVLAQLPGGPRGYQILAGAASGEARTQLLASTSASTVR